MREYPSIVGHRGAAALAPENTLSSIDRAVRDGADAVEFDVRLTADGRVVLLHDATLDRTTDGAGPVGSRPFSEVRALDAGSWFHPRFRGEHVPGLEEALNAVPHGVEVIVELKAEPDTGGTLLEAVLRALAGVDRFGRATVSGTCWDLLALPRAEWASFRRGLVFGRRETRDPFRFASGAGFEEIHPNWLRLDDRFRSRARSGGLAVRPYTVNGGAALASALRHGVDGLITDDPGALRHMIESGDPQ